MQSSDPASQVVGVVLSDGGVLNITSGAVAGASFRRHAVAILKALYPNEYSTYRTMKYVGTTSAARGVATPASRRDAYAHALKVCAAKAVETYFRIESSS